VRIAQEAHVEDEIGVARQPLGKPKDMTVITGSLNPSTA
jgi:hypothetical protein